VSLKKEGEKKEKASGLCLKLYNSRVSKTVVRSAILRKLSYYFHIPSPLSRILIPAKSKSPITNHLIVFGLVLTNILAPILEPRIIPRTEGMVMIGRIAPELM
jgi:hypothetical protein